MVISWNHLCLYSTLVTYKGMRNHTICVSKRKLVPNAIMVMRHWMIFSGLPTKLWLDS